MEYQLVCNSSGDNNFKPCAHNWVIYTPFRGEAYICCSKAGCTAIKDAPAKDTSHLDAMYGVSYGEYGRLPIGTKVVDRSKDNVVCPVVSDYNKARLNKLYGR